MASNDVLLEKIENLSQKVEDGFRVMHDKQDKTNGNVKKNSEHRVRIEGQLDTWKYIISLIGVTNIGLIIKVITDFVK